MVQDDLFPGYMSHLYTCITHVWVAVIHAAVYERLVIHIWLHYIKQYMQGALALTPDKILLRRTPTMPDAPATKGKARSLLALAPIQPSLPGPCSVNGGLKLAFMPSCDWATANTCLNNLRASGSSRS